VLQRRPRLDPVLLRIRIRDPVLFTPRIRGPGWSHGRIRIRDQQTKFVKQK
jgi:hypothetical protein